MSSIALNNLRPLARINLDPQYVFGIIIFCSDEAITKKVNKPFKEDYMFPFYTM